jgi:hypothetical protein
MARNLPGRRPRPAHSSLNGTAAVPKPPRLTVTLSVDFETLRQLLIELGPSLSIEDVKVR